MSYSGFNIGSVNVAPALVLAPMSGVTNSAFRRLIKSLNPDSVGLLVTEFISVEGLTRQNLRSMQMMRFRPQEQPVSVQIFGHDVDRMIDSAKMIQDAGADIVDINSGCPVPKVVRRGGGCELMRQPDHMAKMLAAVRKAVSIPLTLKIRSGWDENSKNAHEIARIAEDCGVAMLAVHGRTRAAFYRGDADWSVVESVARSVKIPVVGSGDVVDLDSAMRLANFNQADAQREATAIAGIMIGRGALANPWVFSELHAALAGRPFERPANREVPVVLRKYSELLLEDMPDRAALGRLKQLVSFITRRVRGSTPARKALCQSQTLAGFLDVLAAWEEQLITNDPGVEALRGNIWTGKEEDVSHASA